VNNLLKDIYLLKEITDKGVIDSSFIEE
jgi:hypothetical protein